ncbi:MAG: bifunctional hydroxymethylpyrimidine kinase/phosphomethylpyrimidine kinase [Firmicutes bacterium]|nr:bifunctional hydroxymethylpyrimidine kinase/phosphomethylpyrimidine kinase [Bacillota bacterium]
MRCALSIAGSDPSGGAGIQADLLTFAAFGVYGLTVLTAVTAQNTVEVKAVHPLPASLIEAQLEAVFADLPVAAVKTGLLSAEDGILAVAAKMREYGVEKLVVDPVMAATTGGMLLPPAAVVALKEVLLPRAFLVTPNLHEAGVLAEMEVDNPAAMEEAARRIHALGVRHVLIKGGHLEGEPVDLLYDGQECVRFPGPRLPGPEVRGTGCILSAAITARLAMGDALSAAVAAAQAYVHDRIATALPLGGGARLAVHVGNL